MPDLARQSQSLGQRPALVLVDMINGFTDPACPLGSECDSVVAVNLSLLQAFRRHRLPIYFTTVVYHSDKQAQVFRARLPALNVLQPGSAWVQVDPRLQPLGTEAVIEKQYASAFHGTDLLQRLRQDSVDSLVVTGMTTSGCVRATAVDGLQNDFPVTVVADAVGDRNPDAHLANLDDLDAKYADVTDSAAVLAHLDALEDGP
ncbi:isochorismatase family protein [Seongchinamella unica]|uniref:Isochorismatase family protein n=1 Tax=Seongchinamella unica TaxID=2547392 RepID=A0A4R5LMT7_9GAMM|nr:isochorismatase family protein [Seongchinamella unica]TDG11382.1 isochorismatase family protein [Seongchinamella unica]